MATTTNYGWETPDDTDLVKDGAAAIRTLGSSVDTTVFNNASAGIPKTIVDAKGDLIAATAADTVSRLAVGTNGQILTADSTTATGIKWAAPAASGGWTQLATGSFSGTAVTLSSISQSYKELYIVGYGLSNDGGGARAVRLSFNGVTTSTYYSNVLEGSTPQTFDTTGINIPSCVPNGAPTTGEFSILIPLYSDSVSKKSASFTFFNNTSTVRGFGNGYSSATTAVTSLTMTISENNFDAGNYVLYGIS